MFPSQLPLFITVVKSGSFSAAARSQGISTPAVSKSIAQLEKKLQIRLFHRTTHALTLTEEGQNLHKRIAPLLEQLADQIQISTETSSAVHGRIKVNLPYSFGQDLVYPQLLEFMKQYPEIELDLYFDDRVQDLVENGFDIGIGNMINEDSRLIARPYYQLRIVTVCSPEYIQHCSEPSTPDELNQHNCIAYRSPTSGRRTPWAFEVKGEQIQYIPKGSLAVNSPVSAIKAAEQGIGITTVGHWHIKKALDSGKLIQILQPYEAAPLTVWLYYSSRSFLPTRTRLLIDFLIERSKGWETSQIA